MRRTFIILLLANFLTNCQNSEKRNYSNTKGNADLEAVFEQLSKKARTDSILNFSLDSLTSFDWDTVLVLTPYTPIKYLERNTNIDLEPLFYTKITVTEGYNVLAFIKNDKLIEWVELRALYGSFDYYDSTRFYDPSTANFRMILTDRKFTSGQPILKVEPIDSTGTFINWRNAM
ncbi:hypothetical protein [Ekhidna sp.]|uniref:hypothetical protein n=1 Tax=Ekhidna sp. TaxID=2608089 RepID=UPI0035137C82